MTPRRVVQLVGDAVCVQLAVMIEHTDESYVESRGGFALLSHLRGAGARVEYRREAIQRAFDAFLTAERLGRPDAEIGGLGLLVLQRALLAAEDLGGLLHAFSGDDPWTRLRTARISELDQAFERAAADTETTLAAVFRLITQDQIEELPIAAERPVVAQLRARAIERWEQMLTRSAVLWLNHRNVAKATMHGFPIVAGSHVHGPPSAGEIAHDLRPPNQRFAVALTSRVAGTEITTDRTIVGLGRTSVAAHCRLGRATAKLCGELCEIQAKTIMSRHAASVPMRSVRFLDSESQAVAATALARTADV